MSIQDKVWRTGVVVGALLALFLLVISIKELKSIAYVGKGVMATKTISVDGTGDAVAVPDIATFSFTVSESAKTVAEAQTKATEKSNGALKAVRDSGVADKDIKTTSYNISPKYEYQNAVCTYSTPETVTNTMMGAPAGVSSVTPAVAQVRYCPPGRSVLTGYEVSQSIQVKIRDLAKAGAIFTSIGTLEVQNISGLNFEVDEPEAIKAAARKEAIENAQTKAEALAKQLGVSLGRITSFYESSGPMPYAYGMGGGLKVSMVEADAARAPEVPIGEEEVTSNVSITYEID